MDERLSPAVPTSRSPDIDLLVSAAQGEMVFDRSRSPNLLGVPVAVLIGWLLWPAVPPALVIAWVLAKLAVSAVRALVTRGFDRDRGTPRRVLLWSRRFEWALAADGAVFGLLGTALMPHGDPVLSTVIVATLLGIAAIGLVVLSMSLRASLALTVPLIVPAMLAQFAQADRLGLYMGIGMGVFMALVAIEGRRAAGHARAMLRLRFIMDELAAQRQQALDLAQRSSEAKSRFLATVSHEVRTPLHGILGLARLLREDPDGGDRARRREQLLTLETTGEHLLNIINDVLDYSRIEARRLRLQPQPVELPALLAAAAELARVQAGEKGLAFTLDDRLPPGTWVMADPSRLRQVLLNLLGNAVKFTDRGGITLVADSFGDGRWRIEVIDTGPGVPASERERIFQPFEQLDASFARLHGGTGLGLAISRELAQAMGGDLECLAAEGGGARFRLTLSLEPAPASPPASQSPQATPGEAEREPAAAAAAPGQIAGRVLLVEDNPVNAIVAETWLRRLGMDVVAVDSGEAAIDRVGHRRPAGAAADAGGDDFDLVLMDCQMPGVDGFEATSRIREAERVAGRPRLPIVALTANALQGDRERSLAAGMDEHLAKPFSEAELRAVLARHLGR